MRLPFDRKRRFQLKKFWSRFGVLAGILGLVLFSTALLLFLNSRYVARFGEPPAIEEAEMAELIVEDRTAPQSVEEVLANYRAALGREVDLDRLQTLRMAGIMRNNEDTFPVQLRPPHQRRSSASDAP